MGAALKVMEHRATRRLPIRVEVEYSTTGDFLLDYTANISLGGVFIQTDHPLELGTRFRLRLHLPHRKRPLETLAEVCWTQEPDDILVGGMGVRFDGLSGADRRAVERMMRDWEYDDEDDDDNVVTLPT